MATYPSADRGTVVLPGQARQRYRRNRRGELAMMQALSERVKCLALR